jgi:hypothetical protein
MVKACKGVRGALARARGEAAAAALGDPQAEGALKLGLGGERWIGEGGGRPGSAVGARQGALRSR